MVDGARDLAADDGVLRERAPVEQQIVEVDHAERALARAVLDEQLREVLGVAVAPWERFGEQLAQRALGVDRARVDVEQRRLAREAPAGLPHAGVLADEVEQVGGIARVEHAEARWQAERRRVPAHEAVRDRMERAAYHLASVTPVWRAAEVRPRASEHLARRPPREGQQQHALGRRALADQPRDARRQRRGLAGARAREYEQRPARVRRRGALLLVEGLEIPGGGGFDEHVFGR
jgi:hypothetical protein